ncbi:hypothetical protein ACLBOM_01125 [Escherichia coli]
MTAGASEFLAGRAVWASVVGLPDNELMLVTFAHRNYNNLAISSTKK